MVHGVSSREKVISAVKKWLAVYSRVCRAQMLKYSVQYLLVSSSIVVSDSAMEAFLPQAAEHCWQ